ncbi:hypothetical protein RRF57_010048 [Xylaria bambusicola]|uniref:Uncharacterized protein n=1 Tax=Xylaria bambusicola TaxID=326684 RepID=A0AAN7V0C2_9PEZI
MDSGRCRGKRSSRRKVGPAFEFIDFAGSLSTVEPRTKEARIIIRRQAARSGRRKHSRESASRSQEDCTSVTPKVKDSAREKFNVPPRAQYARPVMRLAINGYETMRAVYNFDITTLDSFVNVDLAINAFRSLQDQPTSPVALLQKSSSSFLAYLPSRYGFTPFLNDAMHCVAAKAAQMLGHSSTQTSPSELHFKAIRSLYSAKQNDAACSKADIYCATRLLVLYEVMLIRYFINSRVANNNTVV